MWMMEVDMATFAIDGVRIDPATDRVTHVRWALINPTTHEWQSQPQIVEVSEVVRVIHAGDAVWSLFTLGGVRFLGPKMKTVAHTNCRDGIDTEIPDGSIEKSIDDLPHI
jgi:hypothetical protein